jgi:hypothetical protein
MSNPCPFRLTYLLLALTVLPDVTNEGVLAGLQVLHNVLVERVHVLHEPLCGAIVHLAGVVHDGKVCRALEIMFKLSADYRDWNIVINFHREISHSSFMVPNTFC